MQQCSFTRGYRQCEKKRRNCDPRAIRNAMRRIGARCRVVCHWGVSDGSDGARTLSRSHSAWTEMIFADVGHGDDTDADEGEDASQANDDSTQNVED